MNKTAFKFLPILVGGALGWLLMAAPDWLRALGSSRFLVVGLGVFVLLVVFVAMTIASNLPADIALEPIPDTDLGALAPLVQGYEGAGFVPAGVPLRAGVAPPALLVPLVHTDGRSYATVFRTGTVPSKTSFDVVSILWGGRGGLTTSPTPAGTTLPAAPGQFRQVFPDAPPATLFEHHVAGLSFLEARGLPIRKVSAQTFAADFKAAVAAQRVHFLSRPLRHSIVAIWRSATRLSPHMGPIARQPLARRQLERLLTGRNA